MMNCAVCKKKACGIICDRCGFDHSKNYEHFPTLSNTLPNAHPIAFYITQYKKEKDKTEATNAVQKTAPPETIKATEPSSEEIRETPSAPLQIHQAVQEAIPEQEEIPEEAEWEDALLDESRSGVWCFFAGVLWCLWLLRLLFFPVWLTIPEPVSEIETNASTSIHYAQNEIVSGSEKEDYGIVSSDEPYQADNSKLAAGWDLLSSLWDFDALPCEKPVLIYGEFDREDEEDV